MNIVAQRTKKKGHKRPYNNALRAKQAAATHEIILDGLESLFADPEITDFTMADVAHAAGVAPATVFRQFEGRQALFEALGRRAAERFDLPLVPDFDLDGLVDFVPRLHAFYQDNSVMLQAMMRAPPLAALAERYRERRHERLVAAVAQRYPDWSDEALAGSASAIQHAMSPHTWLWLQQDPAAASRSTAIVSDILRSLVHYMDTVGPLGGAQETSP